jgi:Putative prokaryotic signal transducing protein
MATIDPEQERRRLAEFYAYQMDGELEKVAGQAYDLTDVARDALRAEMARRGLTAALVEHAPAAPVVSVSSASASAPQPGDAPPETPRADFSPTDTDQQGMVTIRQFRDLPEALFAKGSLDSAGIECVLLDGNMVRLDWFISNLLGGVKLQVRPEDAAVAEEILSQPIPENFDVPGVGEYEQPRCPKCQSLDVNFQEVTPAAYLSAAVSVPYPFRRRAWRCRSCDAEWEDDGLDETPPSSA